MARTLTLLISEFLFYKLSISEIHSPAFRHFGGVSCAKLGTPRELLQAGQSATGPGGTANSGFRMRWLHAYFGPFYETNPIFRVF